MMIQPTRWQHQATGDRRRDDEFNTFEVRRENGMDSLFYGPLAMLRVPFQTALKAMLGMLLNRDLNPADGFFTQVNAVGDVFSHETQTMQGAPMQCKDPFYHTSTTTALLFPHLTSISEVPEQFGATMR